jgi:uncharacterized phage protein gp47/JayE
MLLSLTNLQGMISGMAAAAQAACAQLLDLSVGSPARAILYGSGQQWSYQQNNTYLVLQASRLATCFGSDVDTFVGDYGLVRDPSVASTGIVTLMRFSPIGSATILVGATVRTGDGSVTYAITADATNAYWSPSTGTAGAYIIPNGVATIDVPVQCTTPGSIGNVIAGAVSLAGDNLQSVDALTNAAPFIGGNDGETDAALKLRFVAYIGSLTKSTLLAVLAAAEAVQAGLQCVVQENVDEQGNTDYGHFVIWVDDGSGHPPAPLLAAIYRAVDLVRPICSTFSVQPPVVTDLVITCLITVSSGNKNALTSAIQVAVANYVDALPPGGIFSITKMAATIYGVDPSISNVSDIVANGGTVDIQAAANGVLKLTSCTPS